MEAEVKAQQWNEYLLRHTYIVFSDEPELEFSGSSRAELGRFRAELSQTWAIQFSSWNRAEPKTF